jgi:hypothetical protein
MHYIYLLQEREFINTKENIYKVGRTKMDNLKRFNQYPKQSALLFHMICNNCVYSEALVIKEFKDKFKQRTDIGNEYFEGDLKLMIEIIYSIIKNDVITLSDNTSEENTIVYITDDKLSGLYYKISQIFPNYKKDESFGGNKKYIKLVKIDDKYIVYYINSNIINTLKSYSDSEDEVDFNDVDIIFNENIIDSYEINKNVADELLYFENLIFKKIILLDVVYDINSFGFINKINNTKFKINIENYKDFKKNIKNMNIYCKIRETIRKLFHCNTIINNDMYSTLATNNGIDFHNIFGKVKEFEQVTIDIGIENYFIVTLYKINSKYYDYNTYLRKYTPYLIRWDKNKNYYILNRDYEYIGMDTKYIEYQEDKNSQRYIFDDSNQPWNGKKNFIKMKNEFKQIIQTNLLSICLNSNPFTNRILSFFD